MIPAPAVILCSCFSTMDRVLPPLSLRDAILAVWPSAFILEAGSACQTQDLDRLSREILRLRPGAVLIAACSGLSRGREVLAGLATRGCDVPMDLVDLREGCAWIHARDPEGAAAKAVDLVCMGLAGLARREQSPGLAVRTDRAEGSVLVVGGGPAGLAATSTLAGLGRPVTLVDRQDKPGGLVGALGRLFPHDLTGAEFLSPLLDTIHHPLVTFLPRTTVTGLAGDPGRFTASLARQGQERVVVTGAVILACGAMPVLPTGEYRSRELSGVISQMELETRLRLLESGQGDAPAMSGAVLIQCLATRNDDRPYCSSVCCPTALKNGLRLKALSPSLSVTILHRDIMAPGRPLEDLYRRSMSAGVRFLRFAPDCPPEVRGNGRAASVFVTDVLSGRGYEFPADLVVLSTPLKPHPAAQPLARSLGVRLDDLGFACGSEPVRPLDTPVPGVFICGSARWPVHAAQAEDQGRAAGIRAAAFLGRTALALSDLALPGTGPGIAAIRDQACSRCGQCAVVCPYGACRPGQDGAMAVSAVRCQGCGSCAAICPSGAAYLTDRTGPALRDMLREAAGRRPGP